MLYDDKTHFLIAPYEKGLEDFDNVNLTFDDLLKNISQDISVAISVDASFELSLDKEKLLSLYEEKNVDELFEKYITSDLKDKIKEQSISEGIAKDQINAVCFKISNFLLEKKDVTTIKEFLNDIQNENKPHSIFLEDAIASDDHNFKFKNNVTSEEFSSVLYGEKILKISKYMTDTLLNINKLIINLYGEDQTYFDGLDKENVFSLIACTLNKIFSNILNYLTVERIVYFSIAEALEKENNNEEIVDVSSIKSEEDFYIYSMEGDGALTNLGGFSDKLKGKGGPKALAGARDKFANIATTLSRARKKFALFARKNKNYFFYRKYLGRIDHMYERYADTAKVMENRMNDDPVQILKGPAIEYINTYIEENVNLYKEIQSYADKIEDIGYDPEKCLQTLYPYLGKWKVQIKNLKKLPLMMIKATKEKIANTLLKNNKIYGYTVESIVEKNFPPANHAIVSLFVYDSHEKPIEQSVSEIIKDVEDFRLIASNSKKPIFNVTNATHNLLSNGIQAKAINNVASKLRKTSKTAENDDGEAKKASKEARKQMKIIWMSIERAMNMTAAMKSYAAKLIDTYFTMMMRIDNLCKICVKSLLNSEHEVTDERMKTGFKSTKFGAHKGYIQNEDNTKTAGEKEREKMAERDERREETKQRVNDLKEAMRKARGFNFRG
jgi:hypothetical protein